MLGLAYGFYSGLLCELLTLELALILIVMILQKCCEQLPTTTSSFANTAGGLLTIFNSCFGTTTHLHCAALAVLAMAGRPTFRRPTLLGST